MADLLRQKLELLGLTPQQVNELCSRMDMLTPALPPASAWSKLSQETLVPMQTPLGVQRLLYEHLYKGQELGPAWVPSHPEATHLGEAMAARGMESYAQFHRWSVENRQEFWKWVVDQAKLVFDQPPRAILEGTTEEPQWLPGARFNIAESCLKAAPQSAALVFQKEGGPLTTLSVEALDKLSNRVASGLVNQGLEPDDAIAVDMVMTHESVAIYLGILKAGCSVVSIADSFSPAEIATRLRISGAKAIFTQDVILRGDKSHPLYAKVKEAGSLPTIVLGAQGNLHVELQEGDLGWDSFLGSDQFTPVMRDSGAVINILFSSGTTGDPKAIPWTQTTALKCFSDAHLHHDIHPGDVVAWPTNLGWMMGPWLVFAALLNEASVALFEGLPSGQVFCRFVQDARVTMLGVVPSLVRSWRTSKCAEGLDWSHIKCFSSTGECSNEEDMFYLMSLAGFRPVIEYCGGTEVGGGYLTSTQVQPNTPSQFTTPALGLDLEILDEEGKPCPNGEVFLVPPSMGLSNHLLNRDHHEVYYKDTPPSSQGGLLRRHGDQVERLGEGAYRAHGRVDDTMNLGGIKTSSAEIEKVVLTLDEISEAAAIAVPPAGGGPSQLVLYVVIKTQPSTLEALKSRAQVTIKKELNPLFKIHELVAVDKLPRTASNKVMRRVLRSQYMKDT